MIRKGPSTSVRISRGCRRISVNSLLMKEEMRIRNLNSLLIAALLFNDLNKHVIEGRRYFFDGLYIYSFCFTSLDQSRDSRTGFVNSELDFLIADYFHLALYKGQAFQLFPAFKSDPFCGFNADDLSSKGFLAQRVWRFHHQQSSIIHHSDQV